MLLKFVFTLATALQLASAGWLQRRAPLSAAKILEELSSLSGRDFCHAYIGAEVQVLPDYTTIETTLTILKTTKTKTTETSTETIGTLRKGTSTTTVYATITDGAGATVTDGPWGITTVTSTTTITNTRTTTLFTQIPFHLRLFRRQAPAVPTALSDSDPVSISAACTKVINKYPIYRTESATRTKSGTTTATTTDISTVVKVQKVTRIDPYSVRTFSTLTTVPGNLTVTVTMNRYNTSTTVQTEQPIETVTLPENCPADANGNLLNQKYTIRQVLRVKGETRSVEIRNSGLGTQQECCQQCFRAVTSGLACVGYHTYAANFDGLSYCTLYLNPMTSPDVCENQPRLIMWLPAVGNTPNPVDYREGPCTGGVVHCDLDYWGCEDAEWDL